MQKGHNMKKKTSSLKLLFFFIGYSIAFSLSLIFNLESVTVIIVTLLLASFTFFTIIKIFKGKITKSAKRRFIIGLQIIFIYILFAILFGIGYSALPQNWFLDSCNATTKAFGLLNGIYFSFITVLTIGYGDFSPQTLILKLIVIIECLFGFLIWAFGISLMIGAKD